MTNIPDPPGFEQVPSRKFPPPSFLASLPGAFVYPFKGTAWAAIIAGAIFFWVLDLLARYSIFGFLVTFFVGGYLAAYMIKIIGASGAGEQDPPDWPELKNLWDDLAVPMLLVAATLVISFGPAIVFAAWHGLNGILSAPAFWALLAWGMLYYPMGLLAVALFDSVAGLQPWVILRAIIKVGPAYFVAAAAFFAAMALGKLLQGALGGLAPIIGPIAGGAVSLYALMAEMRILGLLYRSYEKRLRWFE